MNKKPIIKVENLGKQYRLGAVGTGTLSHDINRWWQTLRGKEDPYLKVGDENDRTKSGGSDYVWALKDINFEVQPGEILGIIGKNGAGKSTLLKLLSRVTAPTTGKITCHGRIASLLEVGTGFHPELTGRENIFLNGAILGMTKTEIANKFDEIVEFAGCEKYIDTPVKRYSSGMYVRLAFAVAAHLEPDILVVDEVLAVGDAEFQEKAIGKMKEVSMGQGRTVLFVSHNMASVKSLCTRALLLEKNTVKYIDDDVEKVISKYLNGETKVVNQKLDEITNRKGNGKLRFMEYSITDDNDNPVIFNGKDISVKIKLKNTTSQKLEGIKIFFTISNQYGDPISNLSNEYVGGQISIEGHQVLPIEIKIDALPLVAGSYYITFYSEINKEIADWIPNASILEVSDGDFYNTGKIPETHAKFLMKYSIKL